MCVGCEERRSGFVVGWEGSKPVIYPDTGNSSLVGNDVADTAQLGVISVCQMRILHGMHCAYGGGAV